MDRQNYFEVLGLNFDPPEKNQRVIDKAIEAWKKRIEDSLDVESNMAKRGDLNSQLKWHDDMQKIMSVPKSRNEEARALKNKRIEQLEKIIDIMRAGRKGSFYVTRGTIYGIQKDMKLSLHTIEEIYERKGADIQPSYDISVLNDFFLPLSIEKRIEAIIAELRTKKISSAPWLSKVENLYDLACYYSEGDDGNPNIFRTKKTLDLYFIMEAGSAKYIFDLSDGGHLMADAFISGATQVFNTEENRNKYSHSLKKQELSELFSLLRYTPAVIKKDRNFAENCVNMIMNCFPEYEIAWALYNQEAGLMRDPVLFE